MDYTYTTTSKSGLKELTTGILLGDPGRPILPCAQDHPTTQNIIDSVRNTVDSDGKSIYQAVAVPVRNLPQDVQAILERGGALDWVERSIDQIVFSHNIALNYLVGGKSRGYSLAQGSGTGPPTIAQTLQVFNGRRTILVVVPPGNPEPWRTTHPERYAHALPSFSPEDLAETATVIVHETMHFVDAMNVMRNTPHDNPVRMKRFYDRLLGPNGLATIADQERRAVDAQNLFTREVQTNNLGELSELDNTTTSWDQIRAGLIAHQKNSELYADGFKEMKNPFNRLRMSATYLTAATKQKLERLGVKIEDLVRNDGLRRETGPDDLFTIFKCNRTGSEGPERGGSGNLSPAPIQPGDAAIAPPIAHASPALGSDR